MTTVPNKTDGDILNASELFKYIGSTLTQGSANLNTIGTTETELVELNISGNDAYSAVIIMANVIGNAVNNDGSPKACNFKLRTGTSDTATSNTERQALDFSLGVKNGDASATPTYGGGAFMYVITSSDETLTNDWKVHVTVVSDGNAGSGTGYCESIIAIGV